MKNLRAALFVGFWACGAAFAAAPAPTVKNVVLVHGAFADGSSWAKVISILQAKGYNVTAVQNPLTSLADDVAATKRALARQDGPVILVGHSWAGVVITEAGLDPKVVGLVYVAAFAPDQGETVGELGKAYPPPPALASPRIDAEGFLTLSTDAFAKFGSDLPAKDALVAAATPTTTELPTSHVPMLSKPAAVANVIMDAAAKAHLNDGPRLSPGQTLTTKWPVLRCVVGDARAVEDLLAERFGRALDKKRDGVGKMHDPRGGM